MKTLFMLSVMSDIGVSITKEFPELGYLIVGTYRDKVAACKIIEENKNFDLFWCDISSKFDIENLRSELKSRNLN